MFWVSCSMSLLFIFIIFDRNDFLDCSYYADEAYNVDDNTDLFYNTVREKVSHIIVGFFGSFDTPLVILGGNGQKTINTCERHDIDFVYNSDSIRGYNRTGKEMFWIVTNGHVKSMTLMDINKDGKNEVSDSEIFS